MKIFAFVMAVMVLAVSLMPCADAKAVTKAVKTELNTSHSEDDSHDDTCSPFCQCSCCAGFSISHSMASVNILPLCEGKTQASYISSPIHAIALPIWQPPRFC